MIKNTADVLTKYVTADTLRRHLEKLGLVDAKEILALSGVVASAFTSVGAQCMNYVFNVMLVRTAQ